jgi:hypothetical protein
MERRKARYDFEEELFNQFEYYYERNEDLQVIIKGEIKISYSESWERSTNSQSSTQCKLAMWAADTKVKSTKLNGKQSQVVESIHCLVVGTMWLNFETNQQFPVEGENLFKGFEKFYNLVEVFSISSLKKFKNISVPFNQRRPTIDILRWG